MTKVFLALLVLLPLALAVGVKPYAQSYGSLESHPDFAEAFLELFDPEDLAAHAAKINASVGANGTIAGNQTLNFGRLDEEEDDFPHFNGTVNGTNSTNYTSVEEPVPPKPKMKPLTPPKVAKPIIINRPPVKPKKNGTKPAPPIRLPPSKAYAIIKFNLAVPNAEWSVNPSKFEKDLILELTKGLDLPARRFSIENINPGIEVRLRVNQLHRLDNAMAPHAMDVAGSFREKAMDQAHPFRNLPILARVDRTKSIIVEVKEFTPPPKEPKQHAQIKINVDIRTIEPRIKSWIKAFELDVASSIKCEPEQIRVTDVRPDMDEDPAQGLYAVIVEFDIFPRFRDLPEAEVTPTKAINLLGRQLPDISSPLRTSPTTKNAEAFFPLQNIIPKKKKSDDWVHTPALFTVAEFLPDPIKYENPVVLPEVIVNAPEQAMPEIIKLGVLTPQYIPGQHF